MTIINEQFFKMSNSIFYYNLKPIHLSVYFYLVSCAGQDEYCWPSMKTIAKRCGCVKNTARSAVDELERLGFIRKTHTYRKGLHELNRQGNNRYYILKLPDLLSPPQLEEYEEVASIFPLWRHFGE